MSIHFSQPVFLLLSFVLLPVVVVTAIKSKVVLRLLSNYMSQNDGSSSYIKIRIMLRAITWSLSWICACIALAGPSWGTELVPVQKTGKAVSFVFDVSYSMTAEDAQGGRTSRLDHSKEFAQNLMATLPSVATSAVLTKGDGVLAVPLTEDYYAMANLITALSPTMLSQPGSSISKGVLKAIDSFPPQSARASYIVVLTDGDDTDENLSHAVDTALRYGIHVLFVGFGSQAEIEVLAGDGETLVSTALRAEKLQKIAQKNNVDFFFADETTSIGNIVKIVNPSLFFTETATTTGYEIAEIQRHQFFLAWSIVLFVLGIIVYSFVPITLFSVIAAKQNRLLFFFVVLSSGFFTGCTEWSTTAKDVLEGSYYWARQNYQSSVASFLEVYTYSQEIENIENAQYGLFGLSANYIMQGEMDASLAKINEMNPDVPASLDFARWYNKGLIFHRRGDYKTAAFCFKKALLIDSSNINAKINLELCLDGEVRQAQQGVQERIPAKEQNAPSGAADAVFSLIRENEENQWKSQEVVAEKSDIIDY